MTKKNPGVTKAEILEAMAEVAAEAHANDSLIVAADFRKLAEGAVPAAVIHEDDFIWLSEGVHRFNDLYVKLRDALLLVVERDHHGIGYGGAFVPHS